MRGGWKEGPDHGFSRKPIHLGILSAILLFAFSAGHADPIEAQHPVYDLLRRGEARGEIPLGYTATLPRDRREVVHWIKVLAGKSSDAWTRGRAQEFARELDWNEWAEISRLTYRDSNTAGGVSATYFTSGTWQDSLPRPQAFAFGSFAVGVSGVYRDRLFATSQAFLGMERSRLNRFRENYDPAEGMAYNTNREGKAGQPQGVSTFDGFRTVLGYAEGPLRLELGQDWNSWGPGVFQHATLGTHPWFWVQDSLPASDSVGYAGPKFPGGYRRGFRTPGEASPLPQGRFAFTAGRFEYVKVVAQRIGLWSDSAAWTVAHRLTWRATPRLSVAMTEMVSLAGRSPDLEYLLPLVPIKYAEHQLGDRDNIAIAFDASVLLPGRIRAYSELMLDDFSGFPLGFWGNKYAWTLGASFVDPLLPRTDIHAEYARVSPWVFSHHRRGTQMQSLGALLGSSLPADAHGAQVLGIHHMRGDLDLSLGYAWLQRSVGLREASLFTVHIDSLDGNRRDFLRGKVESRHHLAAGSQWRWRRHVVLLGQLGGLWVTDWKGQPGKNLMTPVVQGSVRITY